MTETKRLLKVFLCHAHADRDPVRGLYARLTKDGVDAWLDKEKLLPGADWEYEIRQAVRESDIVVVCLSKQFKQKGFRQREVQIALEEASLQPEGEVFIIPARLEECETLQSLRKWHWVDLFEDDGYERLMRALRTRADKIDVNPQQKKNWLSITSPRTTTERLADEKKPATPIGGMSEEANWKKTEPKKADRVLIARNPANFFIGLKSIFFSGNPYLWILGLVGIVIALFWFSSWVSYNFPAPFPTAANTITLTATLTSKSTLPTNTLTLTASPTLTQTPTPTPTPTITPKSISGLSAEQVFLMGGINPPSNADITATDISPDGGLIAVGLSTGEIQLWRTDNLIHIRSLVGHIGNVGYVYFSSDGKLLVSRASGDVTVRIWRVEDGEPLYLYVDKPGYFIKTQIARNDDVLIGVLDKTISFFDLNSYQVLDQKKVEESIQTFSLNDANQLMYTTRVWTIVRWYYPWDPAKNKYETTTVPEWGYINGRTHLINLNEVIQDNILPENFSAAFDVSADGSQLVGKSSNSILILYLQSNNKNSTSFSGVNKAVFSPDNSLVCVAAYRDLYLYRPADSKKIKLPVSHNNEIINIAFSENGWTIMSASRDVIYLWGRTRWNSTLTPSTSLTPTK
jgi:WD40 repeat protein